MKINVTKTKKDIARQQGNGIGPIGPYFVGTKNVWIESDMSYSGNVGGKYVVYLSSKCKVPSRNVRNIIFLYKHPSPIHNGCFVGLGFYQTHSLCELTALAIVGLVEERIRNSNWVDQIQKKDSVSLSVARFGKLNFHAFGSHLLWLAHWILCRMRTMT